MRIKGVIFDMDGLILDTEKLYQRFWTEASHMCGYDMPQELVLKLRSLEKSSAKNLLAEYFGSGFSYDEVKKLRINLMNKYVEANGIKAKSGVRELVAYLNENGLKTAVATATNYERASEHLSLAGVKDCFDNIICACDLEHGKPFPDVYVYACKQLELAPSECVALEDSPNGICAAYRAGCMPIFVPDIPNEETPSGAYTRAKSLAEVKQIISDCQAIGTTVTVTIDRPLGSRHPKHGDVLYSVNYGYVKGIIAPDGEEQDAYILGVDEAVSEFTGEVTAVIHRKNDSENKWVVVPHGKYFSKSEIQSKVDFQEKYFDTEVLI